MTNFLGYGYFYMSFASSIKDLPNYCIKFYRWSETDTSASTYSYKRYYEFYSNKIIAYTSGKWTSVYNKYLPSTNIWFTIAKFQMQLPHHSGMDWAALLTSAGLSSSENYNSWIIQKDAYFTIKNDFSPNDTYRIHLSDEREMNSKFLGNDYHRVPESLEDLCSDSFNYFTMIKGDFFSWNNSTSGYRDPMEINTKTILYFSND